MNDFTSIQSAVGRNSQSLMRINSLHEFNMIYGAVVVRRISMNCVLGLEGWLALAREHD